MFFFDSHVPGSVDISRRWWRFRFDRLAAESGPAVPQRLPEPADPNVHPPRLLHSVRIRLPTTHVAIASAQLDQSTAPGTWRDRELNSYNIISYKCISAVIIYDNHRSQEKVWCWAWVPLENCILFPHILLFWLWTINFNLCIYR